MAFAHARPASVDAGSSPADGPRDASVCPPDDLRDHSDFRGTAIADTEPAVRHAVVRLKRRSEFLAVAGTGRRWVAPGFVLQVGFRPRDRLAAEDEIGIGFTATKRIGNSVARNRAKRRLREAARLVLPEAAPPGHDYVLIARAAVLTCAFQTLLGDLEKAFQRVLTTKSRVRPKASAERAPADPSPSAS